jgi:hypothetical protein
VENGNLLDGRRKSAKVTAIIYLYGPVAQSVEQRIENPCVGGSIPPQATKLKARWRQRGFSFTTSVVSMRE